MKPLLLSLALLLNGCIAVADKPYRASQPMELVDGHRLFTIEFDDLGQLHSPGQKDALFQALRDGSTSRDLIVFAHGWHHNASLEDSNYDGFRSFFAQMNQHEDYTGVYIGWRGDQYDVLGMDDFLEFLDFPSLGNRKRTSVLVGEVGLRGLLSELDELTRAGALERFAVIGHSLGGSVVFHAAKNRLLRDDRNLYVLLNPAVTDREYKPVAGLRSARRRFPKMVTLQADNDLAVKILFDLINVGANPMGNSWASSHDLNACDAQNPTCQDHFSQLHTDPDLDRDCNTLFEGGTWRITSREDNGAGRETCCRSNELLSWVVVAKDNSVEKHNGILTNSQAAALRAILKLNSEAHQVTKGAECRI